MRTRFRRFQGKLSEESQASRTCKHSNSLTFLHPSLPPHPSCFPCTSIFSFLFSVLLSPVFNIITSNKNVYHLHYMMPRTWIFPFNEMLQLYKWLSLWFKYFTQCNTMYMYVFHCQGGLRLFFQHRSYLRGNLTCTLSMVFIFSQIIGGDQGYSYSRHTETYFWITHLVSIKFPFSINSHFSYLPLLSPPLPLPSSCPERFCPRVSRSIAPLSFIHDVLITNSVIDTLPNQLLFINNGWSIRPDAA